MKKILIIEDEEPVRTSILELLEAEGYNATGAEGGRSGLSLARHHKPDLILCDVMMPELDGYAVLNNLRDDPCTANIPFIFLTAKAGTGPLRDGMNLGADDYLTKPFKRTELLKVISARLTKQLKIEQQADGKLQDLRTNLAQMLPHELLTPVTVILGSSELLTKQKGVLEPDQVLKLGEGIHSMAQRLHRLILNFLTYAELELITVDSDKAKTWQNGATKFPTVLIAEQARLKAETVAREADLEMHLIDCPVQINEARLKKILEELIDNAFKYSAPGTPIRLTSKMVGDYFKFTISSDGRGMTAHQIAMLGAYTQFERRIHEQQGSGLGLIIAKKLTELHRGDLSIESIFGKTIVSINLPIYRKA